ncbi:hypothetical protein HDU76_013955 [Blyttiomyces sp. JEL0837]|nr:hypothetical protein HDU76_013955 [Blyttiomyces sp. JEL0837]
MGSPLEAWASKELAKILKMSENDSRMMVQQFIGLDQELCYDFLSGMLGEDVAALDFISAYIQKRYPPSKKSTFPVANARDQRKQSPQGSPKTNRQGNVPPPSNPSQSNRSAWMDESKVYRKSDQEEVFSVGKKQNASSSPQTEETKSTPATAPPQQTAASRLAASIKPATQAPVESRKDDANNVDREKRKAQKKERQVAMTAIDAIDRATKVGRKVGHGGRLFCECLAAKHGLLTNCLMCGKIVCKLEGPGPCPECGSQVESAIQQINLIQSLRRKQQTADAISSLETTNVTTTKESPKPKKKEIASSHVSNRYGQVAGAQPLAAAKLRAPGATGDENVFPTLLSERDKEALAKAEAQKERLLDYQRNSVARTKIFDNASDFDYIADSQNKWLTAEERALALKKAREQAQEEEAARRRRVITLDLQNKKVVAVDPRKAEPSTGRMDPSAHTESRQAVQEPQQSTESLGSVDPGSTGVFRNPTLSKTPKFVPNVGKSIPKDKKKPLAVRKQEAAAAAEKAAQVAAEKERLSAERAAEKERKQKAKKQGQNIRRVQDDYDVAFGGLSIAEVEALEREEPACG